MEILIVVKNDPDKKRHKQEEEMRLKKMEGHDWPLKKRKAANFDWKLHEESSKSLIDERDLFKKNR